MSATPKDQSKAQQLRTLRGVTRRPWWTCEHASVSSGMPDTGDPTVDMLGTVYDLDWRRVNCWPCNQHPHSDQWWCSLCRADCDEPSLAVFVSVILGHRPVIGSLCPQCVRTADAVPLPAFRFDVDPGTQFGMALDALVEKVTVHVADDLVDGVTEYLAGQAGGGAP